MLCSQCFDITDSDPCAICSDPSRNRSLVVVVEQSADVRAMESPRPRRFTCHVLHGHLSPVEGLTPDKLKLRELERRVSVNAIERVAIAIDTHTMEGKATALYIASLLARHPVQVVPIDWLGLTS